MATTGIAIGENASASAVNSIAIGDNTTAAAGHVALNTWDTIDAQGNIIPARLGAVTGGLSFLSESATTADIIAAYNGLLTAMGKRPYDAEVEYIEGSGDQWIQTTYTPRNTDTIETMFVQSANNANANSVFASKTGNWDSNPNYWLYLKTQYPSRYQIWAFTTYQDVGISPYLGEKMVCELDLANKKISVYREGETPQLKTISVGTESPSQDPVLLFPSGQAVSVPTRIHYFRVSRNGSTIIDLIPVRVGQVGYLYDRVSGQLYGNAGTGSFVLGPDV